MKKLFSSIVMLMFCVVAFAAGEVTWNIQLKDGDTDHPSVVATATVAPGFHLYDMTSPGGSRPLVFNFDLKGCKLDGKVKANKKYTVEDDEFMGTQYFYTGTVSFTQKFKTTSDKYSIEVDLNGQACDDSKCIDTKDFKRFSGTVKGAVATEDPKEETKAETDESGIIAETVDSIHTAGDNLLPEANNSNVDTTQSWWENVEAEIKQFEQSPEQQDTSLWYIFIMGFVGGLIALVTPCVWPMIPMTVSFFLKQNKSKAKSVKMATVYGLSIVVIYVALGLLVTIIFGASALNMLATSAIFNIIFFLLLVVFAISFMGGFELTLPSSWTNKMDSKVDSTTGLLSIFFMAFTLVLVSFSCTGPIIGTLLVEAAATSNFVSPAIGMFGFALALGLPFSLFAMFPTMLNSMPKSGGWMNTVKVVLGFLELALALKFLSVADLAYGWHILDREVFVSLWIVIFALLGIYLLGKIRFPHDDEVEKTGVTRFMLGVISLAFAVYMLPGLWGAPLKAISAFAPPINTQDFSLYEEVSAEYNDYESGLKAAQETGKPILLDFSGFGCVNCRKMEGAVWTDDDVRSTIENDYILVTLMVDDKTPLPEPIIVTERDGQESKLRTIGDKWSYLQRYKFGANSQPYHVVLDATGHALTGSRGYDEDIPAYKRFLQQGIDNNEKVKRGESLHD